MPEKFVDAQTEDLISKLAQDETGKRQYYRPVYSIHKWWARRPGALFRSIILLANQPGKSLFKTYENGSLSRHSDYFSSHNFENVVILDPFMGGGTTLIEANRLGAKVIGCDLNPVAYWIVRESLKPLDLLKLESYFCQLETSAGNQIKTLYKTKCLNCSVQGDSLYTFWVRYVPCPFCGQKAHLFKQTLLNQGLSRTNPPSSTNPATAFCPNCFALNEWDGVHSCVCTTCNHHFDPQKGSYDQGYYTCSHCHKSHISLIQTLKNGQRPQEKLIAIEYICQCERVRHYKSPDEADLAQLEDIKATVQALGPRLILPKEAIPPGDSSARWLNHNYTHYRHVFNERQLLAFHYLIQGINAIPEPEYRNAFFTVFSNSLEYNNMMTPYNYPHRKLHHLFNYHAMPLTTTPVENAVWGVGEEGAGTFVNCYGRYLRAKQYCQKPFDKYKNSANAVYSIEASDEKIEAVLVNSFVELMTTQRGAYLLSGDSSKLPQLPDKSVDFVVTDPPYFDSIHYSELSNFFYVWLRLVADNDYFRSEYVPTAAEAIVNKGMDKGENEYQALLAGVFKECQRVLKDEGKLIFTFHHTKWRAWWTVLQALLESEFGVVDSFPVMSEYKVNPHIRNKQALDMDLVLICHKRGHGDTTVSREPSQILQRVVNDLNGTIHDNSDNKLFLHFMGELLRTASLLTDRVSYDWFSDALTHFDDFLATLVRPSSNGQYSIAQPRQLRLLETETVEYPGEFDIHS
jgi:adenine-specific DNA methylase